MATSRRLVLLVAAVTGAATVSACGNVVSGSPIAQIGGAPHHTTTALSSMLPDPAAFPKPYTAVALPAHEAAQAAQDLSGVADGAKVDPAGCKPPQQNRTADATAITVGTDDATRSTISVELLRVGAALSDLRTQIEQCLELTATQNGVTATVHTEMLPPPPIDAGDTMAVQRTVASGAGKTQLKQSMRSLIGQVDDVRISVTYMSFGDGPPDTQTLDSMFTDTVAKVHAG